MGRRVLIVILVLVVALFAYLGYNSYDARRSGANGDVFSSDPSPANGRTGRIDERSTGKQPDDQTVVYPPQNPDTQTSGQQAQPSTSESSGQQAQPPIEPKASQSAERNNGTAHDTISPHPANGMTFSGTGKYQLYRQGDLTWRLNTDTGQSCILFATDEQWKKPRVYRNGCGSR